MTFWDGLQGLTLVDIFMQASIIPKLIMIVVIFSGFIALVLAIIRRATMAPSSTLLMGIGAGALFLSTFGALYSGYMTYYAMKMSGTKNLAIIAPSVAEAALCFGVGILVMLIAFIGNWGASKAKG